MSNQVTIYWCPENDFSGNKDWSILVEQPESLLNHLKDKRNIETKISFFRCPSVTNFIKNIYVVKNTMPVDIKIENKKIVYNNKNYINADIVHSPSIEENFLLNYPIKYYFFCEEEITLSITSPFFSYSPHLKYGSIVPGEFSIGSWFRPTNCEFNLWKNNNSIIIEENEPIAYFKFNTNKKIIFKRFAINNEIMRISNVCSSSSQWEANVPLLKRYKRFKSTKMNKILINEIKKMVINDE